MCSKWLIRGPRRGRPTVSPRRSPTTSHWRRPQPARLWRLGHQLPTGAQHGQRPAARYVALAGHGLSARQDPFVVAVETTLRDPGRAQHLPQPVAAQEAPCPSWSDAVRLRDLRHLRLAGSHAGAAIGPPEWRWRRSPPGESALAVPELPFANDYLLRPNMSHESGSVLVPRGGLEPPRVSPRVFETRRGCHSATPARERVILTATGGRRSSRGGLA